MKRGRQSAAAAVTRPVIDVALKRIEPPDNLVGKPREMFQHVVDSWPPRKFHATDAWMLATYCRLLHQADVALDGLDEEGAKDAAALMKLATEASRAAALLAQRLRLGPSTRTDEVQAGRQAAERTGDFKPPWLD